MGISVHNFNTAPLVSVYCMTYNQEKTVAQAIESVISQKTDFAFELIIHDDASTDSTADIIKEYARRYPDIVRPVLQTENRYREHNIIYEYMHPISKGRFIALCEGDDYWSDPEKLSIQTRIMLDNPDCTLSFHAVNQLAADGTVSAFRPLKKSGEVPAQLIVKRGGMFCPTVSLMFRRDILDSWPDFRAAADVYDYPLQVLAAASGKVIYTDRIMGVYRFASEGSWTSMHLNDVDFGHIIDFCCIDIQHAACCYQRTGCTKFSLSDCCFYMSCLFAADGCTKVYNGEQCFSHIIHGSTVCKHFLFFAVA